MTSISHDLSTGSIPGHFRRLAIPFAVGMIFTTLYNVVDVFYAGLISTDAQAGLSITFQVFFLLIALGFGLNSGMRALIGNALGAKNRVRAKQLACQGLVYGAIASVTIMIIGMWASPAMISVISQPGAYRDAANAYMSIMLLATTPFLLAFGANGILAAMGDTVSMQRAQVVAFFANLGLNPLFIFGLPGLVPGIGFNGIALSTLVSQAGVLAYILLRVYGSEIMRHESPASYRPRFSDYRDITGQALPATFSMMVMMLAGFVVQFFLKNFGPEAVAAYGIALRIEQMLLLPGFGLTSALLPIAAQNYGAQNFDRMREALFFCFKSGVAMMMCAALVLWFAARPAMGLFTDDPEVIRIGSNYLNVDGFILPVYIMLFAMTSFLQALKRPVATVWISLYRQGFGVAFFGYIFVFVLDLNTWGVWFGILVSVLTGFLLSLYITNRLATELIGGLGRPRSDDVVN